MILLLGGTSETAPLATALAEAGFAVLVSVATDVPLDVGRHPLITRRSGRLDEAAMTALVRERGVRAIVDAAHPYAVAAHATARAVANAVELPYLTLIRPGCAAGDERVLYAADHAEAARLAMAPGRPVLLTIGSRNLEPYVQAARTAGVPVLARVLDHPESAAACRAAGLMEEAVITGRGPFSVEQNRAAIRQFNIGVVVTKDSGAAGGVPEKLEAARLEGCDVVLVRRPDQPPENVYAGIAEIVAALQRTLPPSGAS